jgi:hypothetical protein
MTQEALADQVRELADELNDQATRDEKTASFFLERPRPYPRYGGHYQGRAEGYAYVVRRLLALLDTQESGTAS